MAVLVQVFLLMFFSFPIPNQDQQLLIPSTKHRNLIMSLQLLITLGIANWMRILILYICVYICLWFHVDVMVDRHQTVGRSFDFTSVTSQADQFCFGTEDATDNFSLRRYIAWQPFHFSFSAFSYFWLVCLNVCCELLAVKSQVHRVQVYLLFAKLVGFCCQIDSDKLSWSFAMQAS